MTIFVSAPLQVEALDYRYVFVTSVLVQQGQIEDDASNPDYQFLLNYKMYAIDSDNKRHYDTTNFQIRLEDYFAAAALKASTGDMSLINAIVATEAAIAVLIEDEDIFGTSGLVE